MISNVISICISLLWMQFQPIEKLEALGINKGMTWSVHVHAHSIATCVHAIPNRIYGHVPLVQGISRNARMLDIILQTLCS